MTLYLIIAVVLFVLEQIYFRVAERCMIIDKPNERSSHSHPTIRGGGIIFIIGVALFSCLNGLAYPYLLIAMVLSGAVSFVDDIKSLPNWVRFVAHLVSGLLILHQLDLFYLAPLWIVLITVLIIGVINAYNFMDGINGITGFYSLVVILHLVFTEENPLMKELEVFALISLIVFLFFNARKRARCFAGDVGSVGIAILIIFLLLERIFATQNINYAGFLLLYGVDSVLTIIQRLYGKENIFRAHRKHLFQIVSNEFKVPHLAVSIAYGALQLCINLFILSVSPSPYVLLTMVGSAGLAYIAIKLSAYKYLEKRYPNG